MSATYEVTLGPAAARTIQDLRGLGEQKELADVLRAELIDGPNAGREYELPRQPEACVAYRATPLSFQGYVAVHRSMTRSELQRLQSELALRTGQVGVVAERGCYVVDILSFGAAFSRRDPDDASPVPCADGCLS